MEILFFIILTSVISSFIEYYRDKNKYFRARDEGSVKKVKDFLYGNKHRDLTDALEKIKDDIYEDRSRGTEIRVPREEYIEHLYWVDERLKLAGFVNAQIACTELHATL